jgi:hypothetical protein
MEVYNGKQNQHRFTELGAGLIQFTHRGQGTHPLRSL